MTSERMEDIRAAIRRNAGRYADFLKKLVGFDSRILENGRGGREREIQAFLMERLAGMGAEVDAFEPDNARMSGYDCYNADHDYKGRPNVVARFRGTQEGRSLLLNGHCDVVTPGALEQWTSDPFRAEIRDGRMYGRGTCDMKAGLAAAICAVELLGELGYRFKGDVILESVVDEEGGGNGTLACCDRGYRADGAILMEPTSLQVMPANRGTFLAGYTVLGKPIHASMRGFGVNAIEKAMKIFDGLRELESEWLLTKEHPILSNPSVNLGRVMGGEGASVVAGECRVEFDVEFFPNTYDRRGGATPVNPADVRAEVERRVAEVCQGDAWLRDHAPKIDWFQTTLCFETPQDSPFLKEVCNSAREVMGSATVKGLPCGCDGYQLNVVGGMPTVVIGPGDIVQAHGFDEYVEMQEFYDAIAIYAALIANWVGVEAR